MGKASTRLDHKVLHCAVFTIILAFLLYQTPAPFDFLLDPDGGAFLLGARHVLAAGEVPQVDFLFSYGPASFYLRALVMAVVGETALAEILFCLIGYLGTYFLFFVLARRLSGNVAIASVLLGTAMACFPRYYKFFVWLMPLATIGCAVIYLCWNRGWGSVLFGLTIAVSALFRHDYGAYSALGAVTAVALAPGLRVREKARSLTAIGLSTVLFLTPWLAVLVQKGVILSYGYDLFRVTTTKAVWLSLPHPLLHWFGWPSVFFAVVYAIPLTLLIALGTSGRELPASERALGHVLVVVAIAGLTQSAHRAEVGHLLQVTACPILCLGLIWRLFEHAQPETASATTRSLRFGALLTMATSLVVLGILSGLQKWRTPSEVVESLRLSALSPEKFVAAVRQRVGEQWPVRLITVIERCSRADERIAVFPFAPQLLFFSRRLAAGDTLLIAPGYFTDTDFQHRIIEKIRTRKSPMIIWQEAADFDGQASRNTVLTHADIHRFVRQNYRPIGVIDGWTIFGLASQEQQQQMPEGCPLRHAGMRGLPLPVPSQTTVNKDTNSDLAYANHDDGFTL